MLLSSILSLLLIISCRNSTVDAPHSAITTITADSLPAEQRSYLLGKFDQAKHPDFTGVGKPYTDKPLMFMRKEAFEAFKKMHEAAQRDGITLKIISSTRNFTQQKAIWEGKWSKNAGAIPDLLERAQKILQYSAMPGASRHHWGTDIDLNDLNNEAFQAGGAHEKVYKWLVAHAHEYGFCQPYTKLGDERPTGYNEERWHWSYMPLAGPLLEQYRDNVKDADITGFKGVETAAQIGIVKNYVLGINTACR